MPPAKRASANIRSGARRLSSGGAGGGYNQRFNKLIQKALSRARLQRIYWIEYHFLKRKRATSEPVAALSCAALIPSDKSLGYLLARTFGQRPANLV
jgi:hypothetical protein